MRKNLSLFSVLFFLIMSLQAFAQEKAITGKVVDEKGAPLPGVTVIIDGTTKGTITNGDGDYSLSVSSDNDVLVFSFIGYKAQKIETAGQAIINVQMEADVVNLQEVVAVGYGTMKKSDLTGAVSSVSTEQLKGITISNADQMLKGRLAGVQVTQNSGAPGGASSIRIRGASSINNSNETIVCYRWYSV